MAQPILILSLQRNNLEALSRQFADSDGRPKEKLFHAYQTETERAFVQNGGKRLILAADVWGFSGWDAFVVNRFPDLANFQAFREALRNQQYSRYFESLTVPGIDRLEWFEDREHIRRAHE